MKQALKLFQCFISVLFQDVERLNLKYNCSLNNATGGRLNG